MEKHRCKVCRKSFPSGRSLGGHMRSHVPPSSPPDAEDGAQETNRSLATLGAAYGLRENPKKTWRYEWEEPSPTTVKQCKECGKCFASWKALFGHMKCHSDRVQRASRQLVEQEGEEQEGSWSGGAKKMGLEGSLSDNEVSGLVVPRRRPRSRRAAAIPASSSSVSEYEPEQERGAITLMMLSRDVGIWWGNASHSFAKSSDRNSIVLELKEITEEADECEIARTKKLGRENGPRKLEPDASDEFKKPKSCASDTDDESRRGFSKKRSVNYGLAGLGKKPGLDGSHSEVGNHASKIKKEKFDAFGPGLGAGEYAARFGFDSSDAFLMKASGKRSRFECTTCNKTFHSYQALGGHRAGHKRYKGCPGSSIAGGSENSVETEASFDLARIEEVTDKGLAIAEVSNGSSKQLNRHECLLCGKVFASGQALGGHKRSHLVAGADGMGETSFHHTIVVQQQPMAMPDLLDLNLPAPAQEESGSAKGSLELKPWWAGSGINHESLVGMISN